MINISEEDEEVLFRAGVCLAEICGRDIDDLTVEMIITKLGAVLQVKTTFLQVYELICNRNKVCFKYCLVAEH